MTIKRIPLLQGHPDAAHPHLCHVLADAYAAGAHNAGHLVRSINVAGLDFSLLHSQQEWEEGMVANITEADVKKWLDQLRRMGERAQLRASHPISGASTRIWGLPLHDYTSMHAYFESPPQAIDVDKPNVALVHFKQTQLLEGRKGPADGFQRHTEVAANLGA